MYTELLNIIYTYVFNYKEPDKHFLEDVLDIAINKDNLREYINISGIHLYYEDILINKENSKKLLRRVKNEVSLDNRILFGLPITKKELTKINSK